MSGQPAIEVLAYQPPMEFRPSARDVFLKWEKLRLIYNADLLIVAVILIAATVRSRVILFLVLFQCVLGCVAANVLYFAGPGLEAYLNWLGFQRRWVTLLLFIAGMGLSMLLAAASLMVVVFPGF